MGRRRTGRRHCHIRKLSSTRRYGKPGYELDYIGVDGKRHQCHAGLRRRDAEEVRDKLRRDGCMMSRYGPAAPTLRRFADAYLADRRGTVEDVTLDADRRRLTGVILPRLAHVTHLTGLTQETVEEYRRGRYAEGRATAAVNREITLLKHLCGHAVHVGFLTDNPLKHVKLGKEKPREARVLTEPEQVKLMRAARQLDESARFFPFLRLAVLITLDTGIRPGKQPGSVLSLRWDTIDFDEQEIYLPETKSGRPLTVPISRRLLVAFLEHRALNLSREWVFPSPRGDGHMTDYRRRYAQALKAAGLPHIRPYDLRHTAGTNMARRGVPVHVIKAMLGHESIVTTQRYLHANDEAKRAAAEILGEIGQAAEQPAAAQDRALDVKSEGKV